MKTTEAPPDILKEFFLEEFRNPERVGCPPGETLRAAAEDRLPLNDPARLHMGRCSECFAEYRGFRFEWQKHQAARRRVIGWAVAASLLLGLGGGVLAFRHRFGLPKGPEQIAESAPPQPPSPSGNSTASPADVGKPESPKQTPDTSHPVQNSSEFGAAVPAVLELADATRLDRGDAQPLLLKAATLDLDVVLPKSNQPALYTLRLAQDPAGQKTVTSVSGEAVDRAGKLSLRTVWLLSRVAPGNYYLFVEQKNGRGPSVYGVRVISVLSSSPRR